MMPVTLADVPIFMLVLARVGGALAAAPVFGGAFLPLGLKGAIAVGVSVAFFPVVPHAPSVPAGLALAAAAAVETVVGLAMGWTASLLFAAVQSAGALLDEQLGLSISSVLDPVSAEPLSLVAQYKLLLAGLAYVLIDGHHLLLSAIADSYRLVPMLGAGLPSGLESVAVSAGTALFAFALKTALPALGAVLLATIAMAFVARAMPESGIFISALSPRLLAGQLALAAGVGTFVYGFASSVREGHDAIHLVLRSIGGRP